MKEKLLLSLYYDELLTYIYSNMCDHSDYRLELFYDLIQAWFFAQDLNYINEQRRGY